MSKQRWTNRWIAVGAAAITVAGGAVYATHLNHNNQKLPAEAPPTTVGSQSSTPVPAPSNLAPDITEAVAASFASLEQRISGVIGIAVAPLGGGQVLAFGRWTSGPAWSTSKVPLVLAALRDQAEPTVSSAMISAIENSDNDAAAALWDSLGDPAVAALRVQEVLRDNGDPTTVQSERIRPEFSAFGQTVWSLTNQVRFLARAACDTSTAPVLKLMGQIAAGQRWGLGTIADTQFKGGWGPSRHGNYLVRQFGVVPTPHGYVVVATAAEPDSGSFDAGTVDLTSIASWLDTQLDVLPSGRCA